MFWKYQNKINCSFKSCNFEEKYLHSKHNKCEFDGMIKMESERTISHELARIYYALFQTLGHTVWK